MLQNGEAAERYLERAEELRTIAEAMKDPQSRETLQKVAKEYERMAESARQSVPANSPAASQRNPH
jgi:DNA-binding ferritin-like protein